MKVFYANFIGSVQNKIFHLISLLILECHELIAAFKVNDITKGHNKNLLNTLSNQVNLVSKRGEGEGRGQI